MTPALSDADLVRGALAGEPQAQRALVERHRDFVFRLIRNATANSDDAFDLTQETFIALFGALARYDPQRPFRAWISRIALNKCRDWGRRRSVRRFLGFAVPDDAETWIPDDAALPDEIASSRSELAAVSRAIARLPANLRDVLLLRTIEGLSQVETAEALQISEKAVETRLYRARQKLSEILRGRGGHRV